MRDRDGVAVRPHHGSCSARTAGGHGSRRTSRSRTSAAARTASRRYVADRGEQAKGVVIAYDRRFASEHFARSAAEVLLARDIPVAFSRTAVPTQMSSYEVVQRGAAAGVVITASHNPWTDNGFKVKSPTGAAAGGDMLPAIEAAIAAHTGQAIDRRPFDDAEAAGLVEWFDPFEGYERFVRRTIDLDALEAADVSVLVEPLYGAGSAWIPRLLAGGRIRVTEIHNERNPYFGGVNPEPIRPHVDQALAMIAGGGFDLGLLLDGDADRAGAADEQGTFLHQLQVTGLLMYYLAEHRGLREPVVVVGQQHVDDGPARASTTGSRPTRSRSGFKFIGPKMIETGAMLGAEESGGFGFGMHLPERDGIYADLMLLDLFLRERERGNWPVSRRSPRSTSSPAPSFYRRIDVHVERAAVRRREVAPAGRPRRGPADLARRRARRADAGPVDRTTGSSGSSPTGRGCSSGPAAPSRSSASTPRRRPPELRDELVVTGERLVRGRVSDVLGGAQRHVPKPWGSEQIWALTERYCGKVIRDRRRQAGCRSSATSARRRA